RSRTLGWFYETPQIKSRIAFYRGIVTYVPKSKIRATAEKTPENKFIQDAIDRGNMKVASIAKNILTQYGVSPENMRSEAMQAYAQRGRLSAELNRLQTEIEDNKMILKVLKKYHKVKGIHAELKNLSGRKEKKFREQNSYELQEYREVSRQLLEWYPDKHLPTIDELEKKITALMQERSEKNELYKSVSQKSKDLAQAQQTIEEFLRQERAVHEQSRKKKKNGDLE
ncbi:MAG: relaxase, partial [Ruminococcus sp.]|nr:relaxase [Ruminococcus sp.]